MWHAGSYDPQDFLGRLIKDKSWTLATEQAMFHASTFNYFATKFHIGLFLNGVFADKAQLWGFAGDASGLYPTPVVEPFGNKIVKSGQPHNVLLEHLDMYTGMEKKKQVLFPHRIAPEKQVEIFRDLAKHMPDVNFVVCQDTKLTKHEYHTLLGESMVVFSANLQETLGISAMEGAVVGAIPFVPDRLSYTEMYQSEFKYPSKWTESYDAYLGDRGHLLARLRQLINNHSNHQDALAAQTKVLRERYMHPGPMLDRLFA
jgi:hypothetical protein